MLGHDVVRDAAAVRRRIAVAGQAATVDEDLTGRENLLFLGRLSGLSRAGAGARAGGMLEAFGLTGVGGRQVKAYSGGMRRRLDLAASFLVPAELYFLDEPTTGLDPAPRAQVWQIVRSAAEAGSTVLLPGTLVMAVLLVSMYAGTGLNTDVSKGITGRFRAPGWPPSSA